MGTPAAVGSQRGSGVTFGISFASAARTLLRIKVKRASMRLLVAIWRQFDDGFALGACWPCSTAPNDVPHRARRKPRSTV